MEGLHKHNDQRKIINENLRNWSFFKIEVKKRTEHLFDDLKKRWKFIYLLKTPPNNDAFKHSGGESRLCTSPTVTLYFEVELSRESLPGTEQKTSPGEPTLPTPEKIISLLSELRDLIAIIGKREIKIRLKISSMICTDLRSVICRG